jgi:ABC-type transporter MlaC component
MRLEGKVADGGKVMHSMPMYAFLLALLLLVPALPALAQAPTPAPPKTAPKEAAEPVMKQLEAFRRGDFDTAYTFASEEIKEQFSRPDFERMVRTGYPEIAQSTFASVAASAVGPDGHAYLSVKIRGANGNSIEAVYELVLENGRWKINGVKAKPDPGLV